MIDRAATRLLAPALRAIARRLAALGIGADAVTLAGFAAGIAGAAAIALGQPLSGLGLVLASRLLDGLDGAVARLTTPTDRGAFLDIVLDFLFYASVPLGFAIADPAANALASRPGANGTTPRCRRASTSCWRRTCAAGGRGWRRC